MTKKYPTKEDIEKHKEQFTGAIRQYILGCDRKGEWVNNALNVLFTDLFLEITNLDMDYKEGYYPKFIQDLSKLKINKR